MLQAERNALHFEAQHSSLGILEREMGIVLQYLVNVGTQAALLGGFAFSLIAEVGEDVPRWLEGMYLSLAALSFGMFMFTVICSTLSASLGPTKAFKGREAGAMRDAVENMKKDRRMISGTFNVGVIAFEALVCVQVWLNVHSGDDWPVGVPCTIVLVGCFGWLAIGWHRISSQYTFDERGVDSNIVSANEYVQRAGATAAGATAASVRGGV